MRKAYWVILTVVVLCICIVAFGVDVRRMFTRNTAQSAKLTQREQMLFTGTYASSHVFRLRLDESFNSGWLWIEKYEKDQPMQEIDRCDLGKLEKGEKMIAVLMDSGGDERNWSISIWDCQRRSVNRHNVREEMQGSYLYTTDNDGRNIIPLDRGEFVLGCVAGNATSGKSGSIAMLPSSFFENTSENLHVLKAYDVAYLIKCRLDR